MARYSWSTVGPRCPGSNRGRRSGPHERLSGSKGNPCPAATALPAGYVESVCGFMVFAGLLARLAVVPLTVVGIVLLVPGPGAIGLDALLGPA